MKVKEVIKKLASWVVSNTIWTILMYLLPLMFVPIIKKFVFIFSNKTYTLHIGYFIYFTILTIVESIIIYKAISKKNFRKSKELKEEVKELKKEINKKDKTAKIKAENLELSKKEDYYFENYHKHVTVYKNGNGIIINSFTLVVNNIDALKTFKRQLDISDAKEQTNFPALETMLDTNLDDRFEKFGFWCKCNNDENIIRSVKEEIVIDENEVSKKNPKVLDWQLEINPSSLEIGKEYHIVYVISVPGMFPIENGMFVEEVANIKGTRGGFSSQFTVKHRIHHFKYTVAFENGLKLSSKPAGKCKNKKKNLTFTRDDNIIFDRYIFNEDYPEEEEIISVNWRFKKKSVI